MSARELTLREAENEAIRLEMRRDPNVIIMGEDVAGGAGRADQGIIDAWGTPFRYAKGLIQEFGSERVRDTPISEAGFIGAGVGAAATGLRPIVDLMFVDFVGVPFDQLMNQAAKMRYMFGGKIQVPLTIRTAIGGGTGMGPQHSQVLYSLLVHIPGLKCVAPSNPYNAKGLLTAAIRDDDPVVYCSHKLLLGSKADVPEEAYTIPLGKAAVAKPGKDVTLLGISRMVDVCLKAAVELGQQGIDAEVIDLLSLSPMDEDTILSSVQKTGKLVIVDEDYPRCGMAADIAALVADQAFDYLDAPIKRITPPHSPAPYSRILEAEYLPNPAKVVKAVLSLRE